MHPILACVAALQCAFGRRVPSSGALHVPPVPGPPASGLLSFSFSSLCAHLSAASICAMLPRECVVPVRVFAQLGCLPPRRLS